jgi:uncharacterized protein (TIGR02147 family)
MPARSRPDIFQYTDFRDYLREAYLQAKARNPKFSLRYISGRMGTRSSGWFSDVVGRRMGLKRELLLILPFTGDYESLAKALDPAILPKQARKSLLLMARLGLISRTPAGRWLPRSAVVVKDPSLKSLHWARIQKAFLELAISSLERHGKQERDFSALTLNLSPENFRKAGEEVAALRKHLLALSQRDAGNDRVYQCNFQIFPLSRPIEEPHVRT